MDIMGVANLSMVMSQEQFRTDLGTALLDKTLESFQESAASMIKVMEGSVNPNVGQTIDIKL